MPEVSHESPATVDTLIARYLKAADRGTAPDPEEFIQAHPEHERSLRRYFENLSVFEDLVQADTDRIGTASEVTSDFRSGISVPEEDPQVPENFGHHVVDHVLGRGAMGTVYAAYDTRLDRHVALKVPGPGAAGDAEVRRRFLREARSAARLRHPNICPVYEVGEIDGRQYICMARIRGHTLRDFAASETAQPERHVALLIRKLALALAEAHRHGILHRDLKSANVMVDESGEPIVMDFGLASNVAGGDIEITRTGTILGTPAYMSPEQVEADPDRVGPASDIYSLGVILYELLTGRLPFTGPLHSVLKQITCDAPSPPSALRPDLDPRLETICLKMMARSAKDRYQSMDEVADALAEFLLLSQLRSRSHWLRLAGIAAATIAAALTILYFQTARGTLIVEVEDPGIEVRVVGEELRITPENDGDELRIRPGPRQVEVRHGELQFVTPEFELKRNDHVVLSVRRADDEITVHHGDALLSRQALPVSAANRRAVAAVLAIGGGVEVIDDSGASRSITSIDDLPPGEWTLAIEVPREAELDDPTIDAMSRADRIVRLEIHSRVRGDVVSRLGRVERLEELHLYRPIDFAPGDMRPLTRLKHLTSLVFGGTFEYGFAHLYTDEAIAVIAEMTQLRRLRFGMPLAPVSDQGLSRLQALAALEELAIVAANVSDQGLAQLLERLPQLRVLHVDTPSETTTGEFLASVAKLPHLEVMSLYCRDLQDRFLPHALQPLKLHELHIVGAQQVTGHGIAEAETIPPLERLTFHQTGLDDEGLEQIARFAGLTKLSIRNNPAITNEGLAELSALQSLLGLDVSDNPQISDAALDVCEQLPSLVGAFVVETGITDEAIQRLESERPGRIFVAYPETDPE